SNKKQTITKATNDAGQMVIIVESTGSEPIEIIVDEEEDMLFIDGNELQDGDTAIIIDERLHRGGTGSNFPNRIHFFDGGNNFQLHTDSVLWNGYKLKNDSLKSWPEKSSGNTFWYFKDGEEDIAVETLHENVYELKMERELKNQRSKEELERHFYKLKENREGLIANSDRQKRIHNELITKELLLAKKHNLLLKDNDSGHSIFHDGQLINVTTLRIASELKRDGLIEHTDDFSFSLSNEKLKVNGEKQPGAILKKYLKLYKKLNGKELENKANYEINLEQS
ncbi:MAG: hypothetical protein ACI8P3_004192, partial [Saprospiraceae bacterium]